MYGIYANIGGILMVNVTIYTIHGSYGNDNPYVFLLVFITLPLRWIFFCAKAVDLRGVPVVECC